MRRRVAFRTFAIMVAAVMLLSSTSAYNLLVYANQDGVVNSFSAGDSASANTNADIVVQGGELVLEAEGNAQGDTIIGQATAVDIPGDGSSQNPYLIGNEDAAVAVQQFLAINSIVNATVSGTGCDTNTNKYFKLVSDIDLTSLFEAGSSSFVNLAGNAYLVSADMNQPASDIIYIKLDGDGHRIFVQPGTKIEVSDHENFALFGYLGERSLISDVVFENINVEAKYGTTKAVSIVSYKNEGVIENCQVNNCSVSLATSTTNEASQQIGNAVIYNGVAAAVVDNRGRLTDVNVNSFTAVIPTTAANDYIAGLVAQNRGEVSSSSVSGIKLNVHDGSHYIGGLVAYNDATGEVRGAAVEFGGASDMSENINAGGFVGGLVGYNFGAILNSSVTGTISSTQSPSVNFYNIRGAITGGNCTSTISAAYFGGITSVNNGTIERTTVSNLGVYMGESTTSPGAKKFGFGGIAAYTTTAIKTSVASGSFVADSDANCYAGGILAYADSNTPDGAVQDSYALFSLVNRQRVFIGAIVGFGGTANTIVNSYWSDAISGCVTSYVIPDSADADKPYAIEQSLGKMVSHNRGVVVRRGTTPAPVSRSELTHEFRQIGSFAPASVTVTNDVNINVSGSNNTVVKKSYNSVFTFPAGVGSEDKQVLDVAINLDVFLAVNSGDPDDINNPFVISSTVMAGFIYRAPYGHYKLSTDIAVSSSELWQAPIFTGTLDGDGRTIAADTSIFKYVIGKRTSLPELTVNADGTKVSNPSNDSGNKTSGAIFNLNVDLTGNISSALFGTAYNATFVNVALTDGDPTPDDGDASVYEGYIAHFSNTYRATFINSLIGYSYIYGCSTDISVRLDNIKNLGGFIGYVSGEALIDNCAVTSMSVYVENSTITATRSAFIGNISDLTGNGAVINSVVGTRVVGTGTVYAVFGGTIDTGSTRFDNITWSKVDYFAAGQSTSNYHNQVNIWGGERDYSSITKQVTSGSRLTYAVEIPRNSSLFANATLADFDVTLVNIDEQQKTETEAVANNITLDNVSVMDSNILLDITVSSAAVTGENITVKIYHYETGFVTYVKIVANEAVFEPSEDGYYHINTPEDLILLSNLTRDEQVKATGQYYTRYAYKLMADIDMTGYEYNSSTGQGFRPIATVAGDQFTGIFDGNGHTISGLTINSTDDNVALFAQVVSGETVTLRNKAGEIVGTRESGIYNLTIDGAKIKGGNNVAVLVASNTLYTESNSFTSIASLKISNVKIINSTVIATTGKATAAVIAFSQNSNIDLSGVELTNVSVQTGFSGDNIYFKTNDNHYSGGIGGLIGSINETNLNQSVERNVNIDNVKINGLTLTGIASVDSNDNPAFVDAEFVKANFDSSNFAAVNAGAVIGSYHTYNDSSSLAAPTLNLGNPAAEGYDVTATGLYVKSMYMAGGLVGSTNAQTVITKAKVFGTSSEKVQILSSSQLYVGGIAGYVGTYAGDNTATTNSAATGDSNTFALLSDAYSKHYGQITDSLVENAVVAIVDTVVQQATGGVEQNAVAGGIVGAINGPADEPTVMNSTVKNTRVEGVVVGGIVGSAVQRLISGRLAAPGRITAANTLHINGCNVQNCVITTPENCYPMEEAYGTNEHYSASYGVGGIVGTNRRGPMAYANTFIVEGCSVDAATRVENYIPYTYNNGTTEIKTHAVTGGLVGSVYARRSTYDDTNVNLRLNDVAAYVYTATNMNITEAVTNNNSHSTARAAAGGLIGTINGLANTVTVAGYLQNIKISDSVFSGKVVAYDCIGGIIGSITAASQAKAGGEAAPANFMTNIAVTGKLESKADTSTLVRGGIAIGHLTYRLGSVLASSKYAFSFAAASAATDAPKTFNNIYYSTLGVEDTNIFPFFGFCGAMKVDQSQPNEAYIPVVDASKETLLGCYIDTNLAADNTTIQMPNQNNQTSEFEMQTPPLVSRGDFSLTNERENGELPAWVSANSNQAEVYSTAYSNLKVTPVNISPTPVKISINYVGTISGTDTQGSQWSRTVELPVGFYFDSAKQEPLDYVTYNGKNYYILEKPIDFNVIKVNKLADETADAFAADYWVANDLVFTADMFAEGGDFYGGFVAIGSEDRPFTGSISSMPASTPEEPFVTATNGTEYVSTGEVRTISGIQLAVSTASTNNVAGLFGYTQNPTFENIKLSDVSFVAPTGANAVSVKYAAAVAAVVKGSLNASNVTVENAVISGADYSGGLFGGLLEGVAGSGYIWNISKSGLTGTKSLGATPEQTTYSSNISGKLGAAGIAVHTDQNAALINGVTVSGARISQVGDELDYDYFDNGAAGISLAFAGTITADANDRNVIENSYIYGEVAAGAVVRDYTSDSATEFVSGTTNTTLLLKNAASEFKVNAVDIKNTTVEGYINLTSDMANLNNKLVATGGIVARFDLSANTATLNHEITNCTLDSQTVVTSLNGTGGILGTYEMWPTNNADLNNHVFNVLIDGCTVAAKVQTTAVENTVAATYNGLFINSGCGGVIGYLSTQATIQKTFIRNTSVTGIISGNSVLGGIVGGLWTNAGTTALIRDGFSFDSMQGHFTENCVISADFVNATTGEDAFSTKNRTRAVGIIIGHVYNAARANSLIFDGRTNFDTTNFTNQPFFNIYYSGFKYPSGSAYLFGLNNPTATNLYSLNYSTVEEGGADYTCYTDYVYEINYYSEADNELNAVINADTHALEFADSFRITPPTKYSENGIWVVDDQSAAEGYTFALNAFAFNSATKSPLNYGISIADGNNPLNGFALNTLVGAGQGAGSSQATLSAVITDNSIISITPTENGASYTIQPTETLTATQLFNVIFVYSNGLELAVPFRIDVTQKDYFFTQSGSGENAPRTYYVFNASNLYSTLQNIKPGNGDSVVQAFDAYCSVNDTATIYNVNKFIENVTLSQVYDSEFITTLESSYHSNPNYDKDKDPRADITIYEYLGLSDGSSLASVPLIRLVKTVAVSQFGDYEQMAADSLYSAAVKSTLFTSSFTVQPATDFAVTITENGEERTYTRGLSTEYYSIYGLELHSTNTVATGTDSVKAGMFDALGQGAYISGVTFINPKIEIIGSKDEQNFVGVLAGTATGATIENVSVINTDPSNKANAYVMSLRDMMAASTVVGGIVGRAASGTTLSDCSVNGLDIVGASLAGNVSGQNQIVYVGAIAGISDVDINNPTVQNSRVLAGHNDGRYRTTYTSYVGGVAGKLAGSVSSPTITDTVLRDCDCEVTINDNGKGTGSYAVNENGHSFTADWVGGVAGHASGNFNVSDAQISNVEIVAFDIAGGIAAFVESNASNTVSVTDSQLNNNSIKLLSSSTYSTTQRNYYNAVGGIVGVIGELSAFNVNNTDVNGYTGTYSYDNQGKDAAAGGIIGFILTDLTSFDVIEIYSVSVQGQVYGFRSGKIDASLQRYLGAAGGFIGKILSTAVRTLSTPMVSESVMSAEVNLYRSVSGSTVNASLPDPANENSTNVGKLIGHLVSPESGTNLAKACTDIESCFKNIIISSYPQDIIAFGCNDFYTSQNISAADACTDINKATYTYTDENGNPLPAEIDSSFMIGSATDMTSDPALDTYSSMAIIPVDVDNVQTSISRFFRLNRDGMTFAGGNKVVSFDPTGNVDIVLSSDDETTAQITIEEGYSNPYGVLTLSNVDKEIIGIISLSYNYGLQVGVQFIGTEIEGRGTQDNPFLVSKPSHFAVVRALRDAYYKQVNDIDLAPQYGYSEAVTSPIWATSNGFDPIGTKTAPFIGNYDGQGYLITNLYINRVNTNNVGFFGYVGSASKMATIENVHIEIATDISVSRNSEDLSDVTVVSGVIGKDCVGGLVGYSTSALIQNCSVVKGDILGATAVGGLIGQSKAANVIACFTSTTASSYSAAVSVPSSKNVGALIGNIEGSSSITNSFTLGYASAGVNGANNYGTAGGLIGYVNSGVALNISGSFIGASTSDYRGEAVNNVYYKGLTVGAADPSAIITVSNTLISAPSALSYADNKAINPIAGRANSTNTSVENVKYNSAIIGTLSSQTSQTNETGILAGGFSLEGIRIGLPADESIAQIDDAYTAAYVELASISIDVNEQEVKDRESGAAYAAGLFYPVKFSGTGWQLTSSVMDMSDTQPYPEMMDADFYGNGSNKNTDLLFKDGNGYTAVHLNVFTDNAENYIKDINGVFTGETHINGEFFSDCKSPYFTIEKQMDGTQVTLYRKFVYPVQVRYEGGRSYPLSTERQLNALSDPAPAGTKFADLKVTNSYTLIENIAITSDNFKPIEGYTGRFNGNNCAITNLTINAENSNNVGLFSTLTNGYVKNLTLVVNSVKGTDNVGALAGAIVPADNDSIIVIENCNVFGTDESSSVSGKENVGGLIGTASYSGGSFISKCSTDVTVNGTNVVGGMLGYNQLPVDNSYATGAVNAVISTGSAANRGVGGLIGSFEPTASQTGLTYSFASGAIEVNEVSGYNTAVKHGVGGLVGYVGTNANIKAVFSSGSVRYCFGDDDDTDITSLLACTNLTLGIGGLFGVLDSDVVDVYSSTSIAAKVGDVNSSVKVGIGGVAGIANADLQSAYSSGSTLGMTASASPNASKYGVGGVIGIVSAGASGNNLYFDINVSVLENAVGIEEGTVSNDDYRTTEQMTNGSLAVGSALGNSFGYTDGAYPYLTTFFGEGVSTTIQFNALLSIVAIQLNELDETAKNGEGISMAMKIPTGITHNGVTYTYGFEADNTYGDSATSIVDTESNLLSVQRTSNTSEQANFLITIKTVGGNESGEDGVLYSTIASRQLSRVCAQMLGTERYPYLVASQTDLEHVAMSLDEHQLCPTDSYYYQWNKPLNENGTHASGMVYYRMMGPITLNGYARHFSTLENGYSFDGNGYELRELSTALAETLESGSVVKNIKIVDAAFDSTTALDSTGVSLVGTIVNGRVDGVTLNGTATGSNVAGIAVKVEENGTIYGTVSNLNYTGDGYENIAGLALENAGTIELSASVGSFTGSNLTNVNALVGENTGTVKNSFTLGDIKLTAPLGVVAGFIGNNSGTIENCYTRCNVMVDNADVAPAIGSFAAINTGSVAGCYASGLFDVRAADSTPASGITSIFIGNNSGTVTESMLDKQMSGTCFKDDFWLATHTTDIINLTDNHSLTEGTDDKPSAYTLSAKAESVDDSGNSYKDEYPQLTAVLNTLELVDGVETAQSRAYRTLRSYSAVSAATAIVPNDNYINNLPVGSKSPISLDFTWVSLNQAAGQAGYYGSVTNPTGKNFTANTVNESTTFYTTVKIDDYYNLGAAGKAEEMVDYTFNLYPAVTSGANPNFSGGNGTTEPFRITTKEQVVALSYYGANPDNSFIVMNDIDMTGTNWSAYIDNFKAKLNGNGKVLANITIPEQGNGALFGSINCGSVENLGVAGINVMYAGQGVAGMLAAKVKDATITNCLVSGTINAANGSAVGGIAGETEGVTVIDGCVVSGKIDSGAAYVGGVVGQAIYDTTVSNSLSTVFVNGGENTTSGGIIGGTMSSATAVVTNTVFAGNVKGSTAGNIAGRAENITVTNSYYDKNFSTVSGNEFNGEIAATTHYLTSGAAVSEFGDAAARYTDLVGYPVPAAFTDTDMYSELFINSVKLASAKIVLSSGVSAGTVTAFTSATAPSALGSTPAILNITVSGDSEGYVSGGNNSFTVNTGSMPLDQRINGIITYTLGDSDITFGENTKVTRYVDFTLGKIVNKITYIVNGLPANSHTMLSVITGKGNTATAATAFDTAGAGVLCNNMVFDFEVDTSNNASLFTVDTKLVAGYRQGVVTVKFHNGDSSQPVYTATVDTAQTGKCDIVIPSTTASFTDVEITVNTVEDTIWGIHKHQGLFN